MSGPDQTLISDATLKWKPKNAHTKPRKIILRANKFCIEIIKAANSENDYQSQSLIKT
jgi:hypothetical protein